MDQPPKHKLFENPFKALQVLPEEGEGQDPTSYIVREHENRWGEHVADISKDIAIQAATQGRFGDTPASEQTIDVAATEVLEMHPTVYKRAVAYHRNNPDAGWSAAIRAAKLPSWENRTVYIPPNERIGTQKGDPLQSVNPEPFKQEYVEPTAIEIADKINHTMKWWGNKNLFYGKERKFNLSAFRNSLTSDQKRSFAIIYSTTPHTEIGLSWDDHRKLLVDGFTSLYGDAMQKNNYSPEDIEIDHLYTLVQSMPIYADLSLTDPLYHKIQKRLLSASYKPGNAESNLGALDPQTHRVKTAYYNKLHGPSGNRFFTPERVEYMKKGETERMEVLEDYIEAVNEGTRIMNEGQAVWDTLYSKNEILPEELAERLSSIQVGPNGELRQYPTPRLRELITEIVKNYPVNKEPPDILKLAEQFKDYNPELDVFLRSDPTALEKLAFRIQGGTTAEMKKRYKNYNPDQMELIFNKLTGPQVTAIMRAYGYGGKKDLPKKGLNLDNIMRKDE